MNTYTRWFIFRTPRVLCVAFAIFLSLFALDVFEEGYGFWRTLAAFLIHLVPAAGVLALLLAAWRWGWIGTAAFAGLGLAYAMENMRHPSWVLTISGPLIVIAALFLVGWLKRAELPRGGR